MLQYVIYDHPTDYPDMFVIREWEIAKNGSIIPKQIVFKSFDVDVVRGYLRMRGLINIGRYKNDDPKILEVWI